MDVGTKAKTRTYLNVISNDQVEYTLAQEKGTCQEWELENSSTSITATVTLIVFLTVALL